MAKWVKKANQWVVTKTIHLDRGKMENEQHWFSTKEEAEKFEKESVREEQNGSNK